MTQTKLPPAILARFKMLPDAPKSFAEGAAAYTARVISPHDVSPEERARWDEYCRSSAGRGGAFYSYAYVKAVADVRPNVRVAVLEQAGSPVGFLPFQFADRWHRWLKAAEPVGDEMAMYFGVITKPGLRVDPKQLLRQAGLGSLLFTNLDESQLALGLTGQQPDVGLRIEFPRGSSAYWTALKQADKRFVDDTSRRERNLAKAAGPLHFQFQTQDTRSALNNLVQMKRQQYSRTGPVDGLAEQWKRDLLFRLAGSSDPSCSGVLSVLHAGGTWVASHFGVRSSSTLYYWFPVYNPEFRAYSPGRLLLCKIIDAAADQGIVAIDRGPGDSQAKRDFANNQHLYYRGLWCRPTLGSLCFRAQMSWRWRVEKANKRFFRQTDSALGQQFRRCR